MRRALALIAVLLGGSVMVALVVTTPRRRPPSLAEQLRAEALPAELEPLRRRTRPKTAPGPGDWLAEHPEEGQTVAAHRAAFTPVAGRTLYLVPTEELEGDPQAARLLGQLVPLLAAHFQLRVERLPALPRAVAAQHERPGEFGPQWLTSDVMEALSERKPADAAAVLALTTVDLYPDPEWNFVFGEASPETQLAVMSLARSGDLTSEYELVLTRTWATAAHEVGHLFQLAHCVAWECQLNGSNHREEADAQPLEPCPHCLAKLMHATGLSPRQRWQSLRAAFADAGLTRGVEELDARLAP